MGLGEFVSDPVHTAQCAVSRDAYSIQGIKDPIIIYISYGSAIQMVINAICDLFIVFRRFTCRLEYKQANSATEYPNADGINTGCTTVNWQFKRQSLKDIMPVG